MKHGDTDVLYTKKKERTYMTNRLKPLNDFIFHKLFGEEESKELLIGFLNAVLETNIEDVVIENRELQRTTIEDKLGVLDIKATFPTGEKCNIEVQLLDRHNMIQRTLFYWAKLYTENFERRVDYKKLKRTVTINILDFNLKELSQEAFHSSYQLREKQTKNQLTDLIEMHFIETPKFEKMQIDLNNPLHRWLAFLNKDVSNEILEEAKEMDQLLRKADERLTFLSSDPKTIEEYRQRERAIADERNRMEGSREEGREEGRQEVRVDMVKGMIRSGIPIDTVRHISGMDRESIEALVKEVADELEQ